MQDGIRNIKLHILALILVIIAEWTGIFKFQLGRGIIALFPMLYALIFGIVAKFIKAANEKDMGDAGSLVGVTLMLLMAKYGTTIGPTLPKIISASPALILQEIGNIGTVLLGVPVAIALGLHREAIGGAHSIAREPNIAIIADRFGLDSEEGEGVLGVYIVGTVFGTTFYRLVSKFIGILYATSSLFFSNGIRSRFCKYDDSICRSFIYLISRYGGNFDSFWSDQ